MFPTRNISADRNNSMSISAEQIGRVVKETRKSLGVTQRQLAMTAGTGLRFVIDLEKGKSSCHLGKVLIVLNALGIEVDLKSGSLEKT